MGMEEYKLEAHPVSKKEAIIQGDCYRITMLTSALVRLEYNSEGVFEDRATQSVLNRDFPVPEFKVVEDEEELVIYTDSLEIHYNRKPFAANGLSIKVVGGGPACLRLRVVLTEEERRAVNPAVMMNDTLFNALNDWVDRYYRDRLTAADLADPQLLREGREALDVLSQLLNLGSVYPFQREGGGNG